MPKTKPLNTNVTSKGTYTVPLKFSIPIDDKEKLEAEAIKRGITATALIRQLIQSL